MWTDTTRAPHARSALALPSDVTDAEWAVLEPLLPPSSHVGRPRKWLLRRIVEAIPYLLRGGLPWRVLRPCFPSVSTVRHWFYPWRDNELWLSCRKVEVTQCWVMRLSGTGKCHKWHCFLPRVQFGTQYIPRRKNPSDRSLWVAKPHPPPNISPPKIIVTTRQRSAGRRVCHGAHTPVARAGRVGLLPTPVPPSHRLAGALITTDPTGKSSHVADRNYAMTTRQRHSAIGALVFDGAVEAITRLIAVAGSDIGPIARTAGSLLAGGTAPTTVTSPSCIYAAACGRRRGHADRPSQHLRLSRREVTASNPGALQARRRHAQQRARRPPGSSVKTTALAASNPQTAALPNVRVVLQPDSTHRLVVSGALLPLPASRTATKLKRY